MTLDDRSRTAMTFNPDHLATLNEAATPGPWAIAFTGYHGDAEQLDGICLDFTDLPHEGPTFDFRDFTETDCELLLYLRNHANAILDQAAELATLRARVEELDGQVMSILAAPILAAERVPDGLMPLLKAVIKVASQRHLAASTPDTGSET